MTFLLIELFVGKKTFVCRFLKQSVNVLSHEPEMTSLINILISEVLKNMFPTRTSLLVSGVRDVARFVIFITDLKIFNIRIKILFIHFIQKGYIIRGRP